MCPRSPLCLLAALLFVAVGCKNSRSLHEPVTRGQAPTQHTTLPRPLATELEASALPLNADDDHELQLASWQDKPRQPLGQRLELPRELPGSDAAALELPRKDPERKQAIDRHFPALPPVEPLPVGAPGAEGKPLTLADLQCLARLHSPTVRQAAAAVEAARGVAIQVGLCPNPRIGYEADTMAQAKSAGLQGGFIEQTLKTGHKLKLARAAAQVDVDNAELALRRAEIDLATQVRRGFFAVLTVRRTLVVGRAYATLTGEVYDVQVARLRLGEAAIYEALQARVLASQARTALLQARNRYFAEWRKLAATLGLPDMPLTELAGDIDLPVPRFEQDGVLAHVREQHTDVLTEENRILRAKIALRLAEVQPVPDLDFRYMAQKDNTTPPFGVVHSVIVGMQLPVFNHNQGGIHEAKANLARASDGPVRARNELTAQVAAAFQRYDTARALVLIYRDQQLPDQARAYRNIYQRYDKIDTDALNFNDILVAQQTLAETIRSYLDALGELWDSVVDIASLLQRDDLLMNGGAQPEQHDVCPVPELEPLPTAATSELKQVAYVEEEPSQESGKRVGFEVWQLKESRRVHFRICTLK